MLQLLPPWLYLPFPWVLGFLKNKSIQLLIFLSLLVLMPLLLSFKNFKHIFKANSVLGLLSSVLFSIPTSTLPCTDAWWYQSRERFFPGRVFLGTLLSSCLVQVFRLIEKEQRIQEALLSMQALSTNQLPGYWGCFASFSYIFWLTLFASFFWEARVFVTL